MRGAFHIFTNKQISLRTLGKIARWALLSFLLLLTSIYVLIQVPVVQNWLGQKITTTLSKEWKTKVTLQEINFSLFNKLSLKGLLIYDQQEDSLLYVGNLRVRITDMFLFKDQADLSLLEINDAQLNLQRTDSNWRHQFLLDYFGSSTGSSSSASKKPIRLNLRSVSLSNITVQQKDEWLGQRITANIMALDMKADRLILSEKNFLINSLTLNKPTIAIESIIRNKPRGVNNNETIKEELTGWNLDNKSLVIGALSIKDGSFTLRGGGTPVPGGFDPEHVEVLAINASLRNSTLVGDTVMSELELSAKERSGLAIQKMKGNFRISPTGMELLNYQLRTNNSLLQKNLKLSYQKISDFQDFFRRVNVSMDFENSIISSNDLAYFIPAMKGWNKNISLDGKIKGTLHELKADHLSLGAGAGTSLYGSLYVKGLPKLEDTYIDFEAKRLNSTYEDLASLIPSLKEINHPNLRSLRYVRFNGRITGGVRSLEAKGNFQTGLGGLQSNLKLNIPREGLPEYEGGLTINNFQLGELLDNKDLGTFSFKGSMKGKGWKEKNSTAAFKGELSSVSYRGYTYENIHLDGLLSNQEFIGSTSISNEHLQTGPLQVKINWREQPSFSFTGHLEKAFLKDLNLSEKDIRLSGNLDLTLQGIELDNMSGIAAFRQAAVFNGEDQLPLDSLVVSLTQSDSLRTIQVNSTEFTGLLQGSFNIADLPSSFQYLIHEYYPSLVSAPQQKPAPSYLKFKLQTYLAEPFFTIWQPGLAGLNNSLLEGFFDFTKEELQLNLRVPQLQYQGYGMDSIALEAKGNKNRLKFQGTSGFIQINEQLKIPPVALDLDISNDSTQVSLQTIAASSIEKVDLNALVLTYKDGVDIQFSPSEFTLNGKTWTLDEQGGLVLRKDQPVSGSLTLSEGDQKIQVTTGTKNQKGKDQIKVKIEQLNLNDIAPFLLPENRLEGIVSGNLLIDDPVGDFTIDAQQISTKQLRLDNDSIGELTTNLHYDGKERTLVAKGNTLNPNNYLGFDLALNFTDSLIDKNRIALKANTYPIAILERFLGDLFSDITGYLTGDVTIEGDLNRPGVSGKGRLHNAGLKVNYTQCYYKIEDRDIELTTSKIDLDGIVLRDTVTGNPIYVSGGIDHESFFNMFYDLDISTRKPGTRGAQDNRPVQLLKTQVEDNSLFYGDVKGTAVLQLRGPQSDMVMTLNATSSDKDSSFITLPPGSSRETGLADFLVERRYGKEMKEEDEGSSGDNLLFDIEITATPLLQAKVVLDELTGDEIKGNGSGTIKIRSGSTEPLTLRGRFNIEEGDYLFTFQSFFKKPFQIRKGTDNYIEWTGDPYDATIKFDALYKAERVSFAPLANTLNLTSNVSSARSDVYVVAQLTEKLFKPAIGFYLEFPPNSVVNSNPELGLLLRQLQQNSNELNRQVTYLIVFNSFAPNDLGGSLAGAGVNVSTISGMLLSVLSDQINKLFSTLLKSDKYQINLNTSLYNRNLLASQNTALNLGSNVNFSIGRSFLNNRFIISTGLGMDAPIGTSASTGIQQSILLLPDVTMEWLINPTGTIRASFFYRTNADYLTASSSATAIRSRRAGVSLSLKRESDRLFGKGKAEKKK